MKSQYLRKLDLPDSPGVYIFRDSLKRPLYIGRATSLKDRTKSYFSNDLIETRGPRIVDMVTRSSSLTHEKTDSVLEAILLESNLIKRYQPKYNVDERDDKSSMYVVITDEPWPRVFLVRERDFDKAQEFKSPTSSESAERKHSPLKRGNPANNVSSIAQNPPYKGGRRSLGGFDYEVKRVFGPFWQVGLITEALKILRRLFPFKDKKSHDAHHEAFYRALGRSPEGENEEARQEYLKTIDHLILFFEGKKQTLRKELEREIKEYAENLEFEQATSARKLLFALGHINDMTLLKKERSVGGGRTSPNYRLEAYDIAHLSGTNVVGSMVASLNGELSKADYRMFKISRETNNDVAGLVEILSRRLNHPEWPYPDVIIVDGNEVQMKAAQAVLSARRITIPIVAVTKDERHKAARLIGDQNIIRKWKADIVALNAEAHRFTIKYHRKRRGKMV